MPVLTRYTRTAVVLHWLVALLMAANVALALSADHLPDDWVRPVIDTHKSIGITVLGLALLRLLWRAGHPPPPLPASYPRLERAAAHAGHGLLYVVMILLPLSGWMHDSAWKDAATHPMQWFGLVHFPRIGWIMDLDAGLKEQLHDRFGELHEVLGYALYVMFALHVAGALKHQFVDGDRELQRMSFAGRDDEPGPR